MEEGYCFTLVNQGVDNHLWVILSNPRLNSERILIVNLTTVAAHKEQTCILVRGDHPWIRHDTCVNYHDSKVVTLEALQSLKNAGHLAPQEKVSAAVLRKIREGAAKSTRMAMDNAEVLIEQDLIDCDS